MLRDGSRLNGLYLGAFMNGQALDFDWDDANRDHLARHGVTPQEAEEVVLGDPLDIELQTAEGCGGEERMLHVGETRKGRILELVATWRDGKARIISAWNASRQSKLDYLAEMRRRDGNIDDSEV
jgi:uncharacterized protein